MLHNQSYGKCPRYDVKRPDLCLVVILSICYVRLKVCSKVLYQDIQLCVQVFPAR